MTEAVTESESWIGNRADAVTRALTEMLLRKCATAVTCGAAMGRITHSVTTATIGIAEVVVGMHGNIAGTRSAVTVVLVVPATGTGTGRGVVAAGLVTDDATLHGAEVGAEAAATTGSATMSRRQASTSLVPQQTWKRQANAATAAVAARTAALLVAVMAAMMTIVAGGIMAAAVTTMLTMAAAGADGGCRDRDPAPGEDEVGAGAAGDHGRGRRFQRPGLHHDQGRGPGSEAALVSGLQCSSDGACAILRCLRVCRCCCVDCGCYNYGIVLAVAH